MAEIALKEVLDKKGWTPYKLAQKMYQRAEISEQNVYAWVNGKHCPRGKNLRLLCEVLKCDSKDLLGY